MDHFEAYLGGTRMGTTNATGGGQLIRLKKNQERRLLWIKVLTGLEELSFRHFDEMSFGIVKSHDVTWRLVMEMLMGISDGDFEELLEQLSGDEVRTFAIKMKEYNDGDMVSKEAWIDLVDQKLEAHKKKAGTG